MFGKFRVKKANEYVAKAEELIATGKRRDGLKAIKYERKAINIFPVNQKFKPEWDKMTDRIHTMSETIFVRTGE